MTDCNIDDIIEWLKTLHDADNVQPCRNAGMKSPLRDELFIVLAMSHERLSDRIRLLNLLTKYKYVMGVTHIAYPESNDKFLELAPYVESRQYQQLSLNFATVRIGRLLDKIKEYTTPKITVTLDYFFCQANYYKESYGLNWLVKDGKAQLLLHAGVTEIYLPVDQSGHITNMMEAFSKLKSTAMIAEYVTSSPLYEWDLEIPEIPDRETPPNQVRRHLIHKTPFLRITKKIKEA